jgi:hypothetical protein
MPSCPIAAEFLIHRDPCLTPKPHSDTVEDGGLTPLARSPARKTMRQQNQRAAAGNGEPLNTPTVPRRTLCPGGAEFIHLLCALIGTPVKTEFPVSYRKQKTGVHSNRYAFMGSFTAELLRPSVVRTHLSFRFLFDSPAKINRHTELIESPVSHSKQRTALQINRHTSRYYPARQECFPKPCTLTHIPYSRPRENSARLASRYALTIARCQHDRITILQQIQRNQQLCLKSDS